jgi:hypothetical protein
MGPVCGVYHPLDRCLKIYVAQANGLSTWLSATLIWYPYQLGTQPVGHLNQDENTHVLPS